MCNHPPETCSARSSDEMSDQPTLRTAESGDVDRICELTGSSMTAEYAMSPVDLQTIGEAVFDPEVLGQRLDTDETLAYVAELDDPEGIDEDTLVAGYVEAGVTDDGAGEVRWLHVDPERRGQGVGTALFEHVREELDDRNATPARALALADNTSSGKFFERFGFEQTDQRNVDYGGRESVEYVYTEGGDSVDGSAPAGATDEASPENPVADAPDSVTTDDGESLSVGDDHLQGTEGGFLPTYKEGSSEERYGFYCVNCGSTNVSVDSMDRIDCADCANRRKPEEYDGSYL